MAAERPDYDQTLKRLLTRAHDGLLALLLPEARWLGELSPELTTGKRQADLVWEVTLPGGEAIVLHIELQTHPDATMAERMVEYAVRLWLQHHRPTHSVVIYLRETAAPLADSFILPRGGGRRALYFEYDVVKLWQLPTTAVLSHSEPGLWPLAVLMAGPPAQTVADVAGRIARSGLPRGERAELAGLLAVLARARLPRDVVARIVRRQPMLRELVGEAALEELFEDFGLAARAEARGEARGEARMRVLVQALLERRFGTLGTDELTALQGADTALLQEVAVQGLDETREQMRVRLGLSPRP